MSPSDRYLRKNADVVKHSSVYALDFNTALQNREPVRRSVKTYRIYFTYLSNPWGKWSDKLMKADVWMKDRTPEPTTMRGISFHTTNKQTNRQATEHKQRIKHHL